MPRKHAHNISITEPITLADLRWLVSECEGLADKCRIEVKEHKSYDVREFDLASITVMGE